MSLKIDKGVSLTDISCFISSGMKNFYISRQALIIEGP